MTVLVVGGGVVGLCCAESLARRGAEVLLVERGACGAAASLGNAGWVTPGLSAPVPAPGVMKQAVRWMLDKESPLLVRPRPSPSFLAWSWRFARACRAGPARAGTAATLALARDAPELYAALRERGADFEMHDDGLLFLVRDAAALEGWLRTYDELARLGYDGGVTVLDRDGVRALEPAVGEGVAGALHARGERHVRPETVTRALVARLRDLGATVREDVAVRALRRAGAGWVAETAGGDLEAERVVVAAGVWTRELLRGLGVRLPLEGAKGYSVTADGPGVRPRRPLYLTEIKVGVSPFREAVRLAGTLEMGRIDLSVNHERVQAIVRGAASYLGEWRPLDGRVDWAGLRPLLPDGLPAIGAVPRHDGLFVATGHAMNGMTLGPGTGEALAPLVLEGRRPDVLVPLGMERFGR